MHSSVFAGGALRAQKDAGSRRQKRICPILLEASKLVPTDAQPATGRKTDGKIHLRSGNYIVAPARRCPSPFFCLQPERSAPINWSSVIFMYVTGTARRKGKDGADNRRPGRSPPYVRLRCQGVLRIEAGHMLEPGEYALLPRAALQRSVLLCFDFVACYNQLCVQRNRTLRHRLSQPEETCGLVR